MNRAIVAEVILAVLTTQMDALRRLLGTTDINVREFGCVVVPALALFILWELGKWLARRSTAYVPSVEALELSTVAGNAST